jgi:LmbE family N-acetylglucosaminyl deacetylase
LFSSLKRSYREFISILWSKQRYKFNIHKELLSSDLKIIRSVIDSRVFHKAITPVNIKVPSNKRILVMAPHPDDEILGAAGLIINGKNNNCHVTVIYLTSGSNIDSDTREKEARSVCDKANIDSIYFLHIEDGDIGSIDINTTDLQKIIDFCDPDIVSLPFIFDEHDDHVHTNKLISQVFFKNSKKVDFWAYQIYSSMPANVIIDMTSIIEQKFDLMSMYKSQLNDFDFINWNKGLNAWNSRYLKSKKSKYAEQYFVVPFDQYIEICDIFFDNNI